MATESDADVIAKRIIKRKRKLRQPHGTLTGTSSQIREALGLSGMSGATFAASLPCVSGKSGIEVRRQALNPKRFLVSY